MTTRVITGMLCSSVGWLVALMQFRLSSYTIPPQQNCPELVNRFLHLPCVLAEQGAILCVLFFSVTSEKNELSLT